MGKATWQGIIWPITRHTGTKKREKPKRILMFRFLLVTGRVLNALNRDEVESRRTNSLGEEYAGKMMNMTSGL